MSIIVGNCRKHGSLCRCTPGLVDDDLVLWAKCGGTEERPDWHMVGIQQVCCDNGHEFLFEPGDVLGHERRVEDRFPAEQAGHVWVDTPRCSECCQNHGRTPRKR